MTVVNNTGYVSNVAVNNTGDKLMTGGNGNVHEFIVSVKDIV